MYKQSETFETLYLLGAVVQREVDWRSNHVKYQLTPLQVLLSASLPARAPTPDLAPDKVIEGRRCND